MVPAIHVIAPQMSARASPPLVGKWYSKERATKLAPDFIHLRNYSEVILYEQDSEFNYHFIEIGAQELGNSGARPPLERIKITRYEG